jgi:hypothetical protein
MDKRKRNSKEGTGKNKPNGGRGRSRNNRSGTRSARVGNRVAATPKTKQVDPLVELLAMLRINPSMEGIQAIVQYVAEEGGDYYNLGKAVRGIMKRQLTAEEDALVKKLGANA